MIYKIYYVFLWYYFYILVDSKGRAIDPDPFRADATADSRHYVLVQYMESPEAKGFAERT
jgi:hypothetical protein